jgi:hypothetical protein
MTPPDSSYDWRSFGEHVTRSRRLNPLDAAARTAARCSGDMGKSTCVAGPRRAMTSQLKAIYSSVRTPWSGDRRMRFAPHLEPGFPSKTLQLYPSESFASGFT